MERNDVLHAWGRILAGYRPFLSLEITRECPLRCPGCYAYDPNHLGGGVTLRSLSDFKGQELVQRAMAVVDQYRPLHVSIVGGDPLVRYREVDQLLPLLLERGIHVQVVTSAFREIPKHWAKLPRLNLTISIDGLQPEHDARRAPATYDRILKNVAGHAISVHCTATRQILEQPDYVERFVQFWQERDVTKRIWFSIFTPQRGAEHEPEVPTDEQRRWLVAELLRLRPLYSKLDMPPEITSELLHPPQSPEQCVFAQVTTIISADLRTVVTPCQFGGDPDCSRCGCIASMGLAKLGHMTAGGIPLGKILKASIKVGSAVARARAA